MKKFTVTKHYVSAYSVSIEANSKEEAIEKYDEMNFDDMREYFLGIIENDEYKVVVKE